MNYAINVVRKDGKEEFLSDGFPVFRPTKFPSHAAAQRQVAVLKTRASWLEGDVKEISIVKYPDKS